jgi:hypothetical protein
MRKLARYLIRCTVLLVVTFGTASSNAPAIRAQDADDPACRSSCFVEFQACYFAAYPSRPETNKCLAAYRHCIAHCK